MPDIFISQEIEKEEKAPVKEAEKEVLENLPSQKIDFENQEETEKVILFLRQHPIVNVIPIIIAILMVSAPFFLGVFPILSFLPTRFQFIAVLSWYLVTFAFCLEKFLDWYFNIFIVTNKRIVDVDFHNLIYKEVSDAEIEKVQDVTYTVGGVARTLFNYGDVLIQTAAERTEFKFDAVPDPDRVAKIIQELGTPEGVEKYGKGEKK